MRLRAKDDHGEKDGQRERQSPRRERSPHTGDTEATRMAACGRRPVGYHRRHRAGLSGAAGRARDSVIIYAIAGLLLFTTSAVYHRGTWRPVIDDALRRADHANVYLLIAGSYTPVAVLG